MTAIAPSDAELIRAAIESRLVDVFVSMPGIVRSYDTTKRTASIIPATKRVLLDDDDNQVAEEHPILENVPVCFPAGGGFELHFPLAAGDTGDLIFAVASFTEWYETGLASAPGDLRPHSISHAKFYPGFRSAKATYPTVPDSGVAVLSVGSGLLRVGGPSADFVALSAKVDAQFSALKSAISGWTPVPNDGGGALKTALTTLFSTWPMPTAGTKLKAE